MDFDEMSSAVTQAERTINTADCYVARMASLIVGRLRKAGIAQSTLRKLKSELRKYNPHTHTWRD